MTVTYGKCAQCWCVEAVYLRTNISILVDVSSHFHKPTRRERETFQCLTGALEPLSRDGYLRGRDLEITADGCGHLPEAKQ